MRARRYYQRTGKKITINGSDTAGYDKSKVECFNCHKMGHFARECKSPRNQESRSRNHDNRNRKQDSSRKTVNVEETSSKAMVAIHGAGFDWSFMAKVEVTTHMTLMAFSDSKGIPPTMINAMLDSGSPSNNVHATLSILLDYHGLNGGNLPLLEESRVGKILNIVPKESLTCLVAKATLDESMLWHKRLGHVNFKTINKLVKDNLVRGLPSKRFENNQTCVACLKGKQHKASYSTWKGIKREYSVARTPQQNGVTEKRNRTLIEVARTMLADSKGRTPALSIMRSFGCHVDHSYKTYRSIWQVDGKSDDGFFWVLIDSTNSNDFAHLEVSIGEGTTSKETNTSQDYIMMPLWKDSSLFDSPSMNVNIFSLRDNVTPEATNADLFGDETEMDMSNLNASYQVPTTPNTRIHKDHSLDHVIGDIQSGVEAMQEELLQFKLQKGYTQEEGIDYDEVFAPVARIEAIRLFLAYASFMGFMVYQMDVKSAFLYGQIKGASIFVSSGFEDPGYHDKVYKVVKALYGLHQVPRAWSMFYDITIGSTKKELCLQVKQKEDGIFISQDKYVTDILKKFGFQDVRTASTPMDIEKPLLKDSDGNDVDVHLYRHVKRGRETKIPHSSGPPIKVGDEAVHKELGDRMERSATIASSLEAEQDSDAQTWFEAASKQSNDPPLSRVNTLGSGEDSMKLMELMAHCTKLSELGFKGYSRVYFPLFPTMITTPESSPSRITSSPSLSPQTYQSPLRDITRQDAEIPQSQFPTQTQVADEAAFTSVDVDAGGATTTDITYKDSTVSPPRVSTAEDISGAETLVYIRRSASKDKGKAIMTESEPEQITTKLQQRQERAGFEANYKLVGNLIAKDMWDTMRYTGQYASTRPVFDDLIARGGDQKDYVLTR
ncbi:retrovirus-related pol polyprotein from transposon TNT 1-94 [Tanacetum coccineum]